MRSKILLFASIVLAIIQSHAQNYNDLTGQDSPNTITTAVPFLMIAPDSRSGGIGEIGAASTPDAQSMHWNPAKYAFIEKNMGFSVSYSPWLSNLVNDINLAYLTFYNRIDDRSAFAFSLLYFSLGYITFTDESGNSLGDYKPNEFSIDGTYSRKFSENISGAVATRFIYSNLTLGQNVQGAETTAGISIAADVAIYYQKELSIAGLDRSQLSFGLNISNIGNKISYSKTEIEKDFIPTNLRLGTCFTMDLDDYSTLSVMADINKLLVPTPPIYKLDSNSQRIPIPGTDKFEIEKGRDPDVSVVGGMFQSFYDAPNGFSEEMQEIIYSIGVEYWYDKQFAIRGGYFHESAYKGNRQFFTLGAGLRYNVFGLDFAYLIPTEQQNPLQNTLRFTLTFDFDAFQKQSN
ncbi:MAG: type IX secretion system outer membrane channel protein PorV [Bacteroidales bacterium]|nr:type IX secretion system outer membrane channel protein PorV [Bacteroidales bacterium]